MQVPWQGRTSEIRLSFLFLIVLLHIVFNVPVSPGTMDSRMCNWVVYETTFRVTFIKIPILSIQKLARQLILIHG
jgi:hypothetical protein